MSTNFSETAEAAAFIASADSRETSPKIMQAIVFFARDLREAEALWNGDGFGCICHPSDLWEHVTGNGRIDPSEFCWGAAGTKWWHQISGEPVGKAALRRTYLLAAASTEIAEILESAFEEDDAHGGRFDATGFAQFCPENKESDVQEAWQAYDEYRAQLAQPQPTE
jgi:hypothetical protein